jgi:hypothetical protein
MLRALILLLLTMHGGTYYRSKLVDEVDMIECNTFIRENGTPFKQIIFWEYRPKIEYTDLTGVRHKGAFVVRGWFRFKETMIPIKNKDNVYVSYFYDDAAKMHRLIRAKTYVVTFTVHDPENLNKKILATHNRNKLSYDFLRSTR